MSVSLLSKLDEEEFKILRGRFNRSFKVRSFKFRAACLQRVTCGVFNGCLFRVHFIAALFEQRTTVDFELVLGVVAGVENRGNSKWRRKVLGCKTKRPPSEPLNKIFSEGRCRAVIESKRETATFP